MDPVDALQGDIEDLDPKEAHALRVILDSMRRGDRSKLRRFIETDYLQQPVSVDEFLDSEEYLGRALWNPEKKSGKLYPYWREKLKLVWDTDAREIVATGPIGSGKSLFLDVSMAYMTHRDILCLKDPFAFYNLVRAQPIAILFFSLSKDLSTVGLFRGFQELLLESKWFMERGVVSGTRNRQLNFPTHNLQWSLGSPKMTGQGIIGRNILGGCLDEISEVADPKELERHVAAGDTEFKEMKALRVYQSVKRRIESRFMKGDYQPGKLFLASSKQDDAAFLEQYVERVKGTPGVLVFDDPLWEIKPADNYPSKLYFAVAIGDRFRESKVLAEGESEEDYTSKGYDLIDVPMEHKPAFDFDTEGAVRDIAGVSSARIRRSKLIPRSEYLVRCINPALVHPFSLDTIELSEDDDIGLEDFFDLRNEFLTPYERHIHIDLAKNGDACGFAMSHVPGKKVIERTSRDGTIVKLSDDIVRFDFMLCIRNVPGLSIPFWKIRRFIFWMLDKGIRIVKVTADGWQSEDTMQLLHRAGIDADVLSLDRSHDYYVSFRNMFYEERVEHYGHPVFMHEMEELEHNRVKKKVDHPHKGCFIGETRVPLLDGTCPMIEELAGREVWVYSSRPDGVTVPGLARGRFTKTVGDLVDVVLDNGAVVRCTPDHLWMLRDGTYKEAQHLRPGIDRLRPINRQWPVNGGYERISDLSGCNILTHHMVESYMNGVIPKGWLVHHENEDKTDNRPDNLSRSLAVSHAFAHTTKRHREDEDYTRKVADGLQRFNLSRDGRRKHAEAILRTMASMSNEDFRRRARRSSSFRSDVDVGSLHRAADDYAVSNANAAARLLGCGRNVIVRVLRDNGFNSWNEFVTSRGDNHKVRYVIPVMLKKPVPVYDLEVDEWSNFALSTGVFVHNSKDVADGACGSAIMAAVGKDADPGVQKQVETMKGVVEGLRQGIGHNADWWFKDLLK